MKKLGLILAASLIAAGANAQTRYILRYTESLPLPTFLSQYGLNLVQTVPGRPIYLIQDPLNRDSAQVIQQISDDTDDDVTIETDQVVRLPIRSFATKQSQGLTELRGIAAQTSQLSFFGVPAPAGAIQQPAFAKVRADDSWWQHGLGSGLVAVIDTGVDPAHSFFTNRLVAGIDYVSQSGQANETSGLGTDVMAYINPTTTPLLKLRPDYVSNGHAFFTRQNTGRSATQRVRVNGSFVTVNSSGSSTQFEAGRPVIPIGLGHGTMVAGAVLMVAPRAFILPIRAFNHQGEGRLFDVIRGIHAAEDRGAKVVNLSLNTYVFSPELLKTTAEVSERGLILVASTGNDGLTNVLSYPAAAPKVTGVASINLFGQRSTFSNAGSLFTWVSAPGEAIYLPFPGQNWAGGWGTSFAAPMVSGLAAKLLMMKPNATYSDLQSALGRSETLPDPALGAGALDVWSSLDGL